MKLKAEEVRALWRLICTKGDLSPSDLVKEARRSASPLHELFEWNDATAGGRYRAQQARQVLQSFRIEDVPAEDRKAPWVPTRWRVTAATKPGRVVESDRIGRYRPVFDLLATNDGAAQQYRIAVSAAKGALTHLEELAARRKEAGNLEAVAGAMKKALDHELVQTLDGLQKAVERKPADSRPAVKTESAHAPA